MSVRNNEMNLAWLYVEGTQTSVFLTGKAGTGKTTFLRKLRELLPKRMVVLAPTGVAAINAGGQTIHSFFQLSFTPFVPGMKREDDNKYYRMSKEKKNLIRTMDLLVIDEVSMVRADLLDAIDDVLRRHRNGALPFGGVQLLLIGDLQQLAPVAKDEEWALLSQHYVTPYFFSSHALQQLQYVTVELKHIYRQQDQDFVNLLAAIRENRADATVLARLNQRYIPNFLQPPGEEWIHLTTHNRTAQLHNESCMQRIAAPAVKFRATVEGTFPELLYPADENLILKVGAQVMFLKNDTSPEKRYYNGKIGKVVEISPRGLIVQVKREDDSDEVLNISVPMETWENKRYIIDEETKEIREETEGTFKQYPLRLAWAITIHKSQGLTFQHAVLDVNRSFAHGQVYVALSRCRTLEGLVLSAPLNAASIISDTHVDEFVSTALSGNESAASDLPRRRFEYFYQLLQEQFSFSDIIYEIENITRVTQKYLANAHPRYVELLGNAKTRLTAEVITVAAKFKVQYDALISNAGAAYAKDQALQERCRSAAEYFCRKLKEIMLPLVDSSKLDIGNKAVAKQFEGHVDALQLNFDIKIATLSHTQHHGFSAKDYVSAKAKASITDAPKKSRSRKKLIVKDVMEMAQKQRNSQKDFHPAHVELSDLPY